MVKNRFSPNDAETLRPKILRVIEEADAPVAEVLKALGQCQAQFEDRRIVEQTLKECGLRASGFITSEHLELYFDIVQGKRELGYICKGWDEPGFRVGDVVQVPKCKIAAVKEHVLLLLNYCATRGVATTAKKNDGGCLEFQMESVIYSDGFNKKVITQVLHYLNECTEEARGLFG